MKKFFAFTLSEVLVTLSIVGVISVLTLPNLMSSYQKKVQVASLQRTYNMIVNATAKYMTDNRLDDLTYSDLTTLDGVEEFFKKYFDVTRICMPEDGEVSNAVDCLAETYNSSDRSTTFSPMTISGLPTYACAMLNTGATICLDHNADAGYFGLHIDTNGIGKPNTAGRDFFAHLRLWPDGKVMGAQYTTDPVELCPGFNGNTPGILFATDCFAKIQQDGWEMNY